MTRAISLTINVILLAVMVAAQQYWDTDSMLWLYVLAQLTLYGSHLFLLIRQGDDLVDALMILNLGFFLHFTAAPVLIWYGITPTIYHRLWSPENFTRGMVLVQLLGVCVQAGYYLSRLLRTPRPLLGEWTLVPARVIWVMAAVFLLATLRGVLPPEYAQSGLYIGVWTLAYYAAYFLFFLTSELRGILKPFVPLGIAYSFVLSLTTGTGSKAGAANLLFAWALSRNYLKKRLTLLEAGGMGGVTIILVIYMNYARTVGYLTGLTRETWNPLEAGNYAQLMQGGVSSTLTPFESFLTILQTFPDIFPFQAGRRLYEDMVLPLLPRIFFPDKPAVYGVGFVWDELMGFLSGDAKTYEAVSLPGHFYMDFGVGGIVICGLLVGLIHGYLYRWWVKTSTPVSLMMYGIVAAYSVIASRAFFWTTQAVIVGLLFPFSIALLCHRRPTRGVSRLSRRSSVGSIPFDGALTKDT